MERSHIGNLLIETRDIPDLTVVSPEFLEAEVKVYGKHLGSASDKCKDYPHLRDARSAAGTTAGPSSSTIAARPRRSLSAPIDSIVDSLATRNVEVLHPEMLAFCPVGNVSSKALQDFYSSSKDDCAKTMSKLNTVSAKATAAQKLKIYKDHFQRDFQRFGFSGSVSSVHLGRRVQASGKY